MSMKMSVWKSPGSVATELAQMLTGVLNVPVQRAMLLVSPLECHFKITFCNSFILII